MVDFTTVFRGVGRNRNELGDQLYSPDALCVFHVNRNDDLVPIAIQLVPGDRDTIFTPNDADLDWILAKMYYKASFSSMHEVRLYTLSALDMVSKEALVLLLRSALITQAHFAYLHYIPLLVTSTTTVLWKKQLTFFTLAVKSIKYEFWNNDPCIAQTAYIFEDCAPLQCQ